MEILLAIVLMISGILNVVMGIRALGREGRNKWIPRFFFSITMAGFLWCFGYSLMGLATNDTAAYIMRAIALIGVTWCCPSIIIYLQSISEIKAKRHNVFWGYLIVGAIISYGCVAIPYAVHFEQTPYGRYYVSNPWIGRYFQYLYLASMFVLWFVICVRWRRRSVLFREKKMALYAMASAIVILFGIFFDTVLPIFGTVSFPSSAICNFFAIALLYRTLFGYTATSISSKVISDHIFTNIATPVMILSHDFKIVDCNDYCCKYMGASRERLIDSDVFEWIGAMSDEEREHVHSLLVNQEKEFFLHTSIVETEAYCDIRASVLYDSYGQVLTIIGLLSDTTVQKENEDELEIMRREVHIANATKKAFLMSMDEDLVVEIQKIVDGCKEIGRETTSSIIAGKAEELSGIGTNLVTQVRDLIDLSKIESGDFEIMRMKYDMEQLLDEVITETCERVDENHVHFIAQINPSLPRMMIGDRKRLKKVLRTLLDNAVEYTKEGYIIFHVNYRIRFGIVTLQFKVVDSGFGMREDLLNMIFGSEYHEKWDEVFIGIGRDLAFSRSIIKLMHGEMSVQSSPGIGTTFIVSVDQTTDADRPIVPFREYQDHVLIVSKDQTEVDSTVQMLREMGVKVTTLVQSMIREEDIPEDKTLTVVLGNSGLMNQLSPHLTEKYPHLRQIYVYNYENYQMLTDKSNSVCSSMMYKQLDELLR